MFLQDLIDTDKKGLISKTTKDAVFVDPKLSSSNSLSLWNLRQIKLELLVVSLIRCEFFVIFNCQKKTTNFSLDVVFNTPVPRPIFQTHMMYTMKKNCESIPEYAQLYIYLSIKSN